MCYLISPSHKETKKVLDEKTMQGEASKVYEWKEEVFGILSGEEVCDVEEDRKWVMWRRT
ncbi:unnamed protein product [Brassica rapa subsp. trilocularis]